MLLTASSGLKRLALLAVLAFFFTLVLYKDSNYKKIVTPLATGLKSAGSGHTQYHESSQDNTPAPNDVLPDPEKYKITAQPAQVVVKDWPVTNAYRHGFGGSLVKPIKKMLYETQRKFVKALVDGWDTLGTSNHWPVWDAYEELDYDPNRWEAFDWELGYYTENGVEHLINDEVHPEPYSPYPGYNSEDWRKSWRGDYALCKGARGLNIHESSQDMVKAWRHAPPTFPRATVGSAEVVGIDQNVCFDRFNRYGAYGFGEADIGVHAQWEKPMDRPQWELSRWGKLQDDCVQANKGRFPTDARRPTDIRPTRKLPKNVDAWNEAEYQNRFAATPRYHHRTALLIRTWEGYQYTDNDIHAIRALVTELSLLSGGEYQVFLFVNVKQHDADIYDDPKVYREIVRKVVPQELRDIAVLWTEKVCEEWYPKVGDWQVYWQQFMPLQWFSKTHPEFDFVWNWETDARYTGNHYDFLEKMADFARNMPRKNLWERNSRFFFPKVHGNFASFLADTDKAIENATMTRDLIPIWGPQPYNAKQQTFGPPPPKSYAEDNFEWGVDEEADLITLQPIWDPTQTEWSYRYKIWNYVEGKRPHFTFRDQGDDAYFHPDFAKIPRRVFINTVVRFSKKMLHAMHMENRAGRSMQAEMWPASVALQHGLKAVYAPHPIWLDRKWPAWFLEATFNADGGEPAAWGQRKDSPYNHDREAAFRGWSWYYSTWFPRILYRRWLGWSAVDILGDVGGDAYEEREMDVSDQAAGLDVRRFGGKGRMCLPPMLLHPVKKVREDDAVTAELARATEEDRRKERAVERDVERAMMSGGYYWPGEVGGPMDVRD